LIRTGTQAWQPLHAGRYARWCERRNPARDRFVCRSLILPARSSITSFCSERMGRYGQGTETVAKNCLRRCGLNCCIDLNLPAAPHVAQAAFYNYLPECLLELSAAAGPVEGWAGCCQGCVLHVVQAIQAIDLA
jgi:hypothetical protein